MDSAFRLPEELPDIACRQSGICEELVERTGALLDGVDPPTQLLDQAGGLDGASRALVEDLRRRIATVAGAVRDLPRVPTFPLEWLEPPFSGGHWVPDLIVRAGGEPVLCTPGEHSRPLRWVDVASAAPEVVVFMPCGYDLAAATKEAEGLSEVAELVATPAWRNGRVWVVDATSYFSRPGPRVVDGLELLAWIMHSDAFPEPPAGRVATIS